ncbi:MAG: hypothetical protein JO061_14685 [Acidobacteriaceae bacterium]|nr:hypothetical protein [Acidobacteriaceae bacterium]
MHVIRPAVVLFLIAGAGGTVALAQQPNTVISTGPVTTVAGSSPVTPASGTAGPTSNYLPYIVPGQQVGKDGVTILNDPFDIAYTTRQQPVQTSDWWTGLGLQWSGWVVGRTPAEGNIGRSQSFISEPFQMQFVDVLDPIPGLSAPLQGLRFWNQNAITLRTDGKINSTDSFNPANNFAGRGEIASQGSPEVTVGLANVHPLGTEVPSKAPWSNVKVVSYSDWGAIVSYANQGSELTMTLSNGTPFAWCERTKGNAPLTVWVGDLQQSNTLKVWYHQNGVLGVTVTTYYVPYNNASPAPLPSSASYVIFSDQGTWTEQRASSASVSMFTNSLANRVAVLAMPHNISESDTSGLIAALTDLQQYSCARITDTKLHFPPIPGSDSTIVRGSETLPLGYDEENSILRSKLAVTTTPFPLRGCVAGGPPLQIVFPHHRKVMDAASKQNILTTAGEPKYTWNGVIGEYQAYQGASYIQELPAKGVLPYLPGVALDSQMDNPLQPGQSAAEDIYQTMKTWFYIQEPVPAPNKLNSFVRNLGTYMNYQDNTYIPGLAGVYESLVIADELARSPVLAAAGKDTDLGRPKVAVAAEMRDEILQSLKELIGEWGNIYTTQFFQYNPQFNSTFGYPDGYQSVQNFNDHHFHYGYFLRAAAMIGQYDPEWLRQYMPYLHELRRDVANFDRSNPRYPFLREFSPFYGHSWADGTSGGGGNNQESTSEAVNFAAGLIELGQILGEKDWRDIGMYLFEQEVLGAEQYWFNQDADLTKHSGTYYNGNWPDALVHYTGPDGTPWLTTLITNVKQFGIFRNTFFGGIKGSYTIQATPLSAPSLYLSRNQNWLGATWNQFVKEKSYDSSPAPYEVLEAGIQARLPDSGTGIDDTGLTGALLRINQLHANFPGATNSMGKFWAYTNANLGQLDATVVANTPSYAVFKKTGKRTYVAYNPSSAPLTVTFTDTVTLDKFSLTVPPHSTATSGGQEQVHIDTLTPYVADPRRLYLRASGDLTLEPGSWMLPAGETAYPSDAAALDPSLKTVPVRPDAAKSTPIDIPDSSVIVSWTGTFSGRLVAEDKPVTRFALYFDQSLFPGWQRDPKKAPNTVTIRFLYDFDSDGTPDRIEIVQNVPMVDGNCFLYQSKVTEYYTDQYFGGPDGRIPVFVGIKNQPGGNAPFPAVVKNGTLTVEIYGGSGAQPLFPVPVSVEADPLLNRASWVEPPYGPLSLRRIH